MSAVKLSADAVVWCAEWMEYGTSCSNNETTVECSSRLKMEKFAEFVSSIGHNGKTQYMSNSSVSHNLPMSNHVESYGSVRHTNHEQMATHLPSISQANTGNALCLLLLLSAKAA